jgi:hypothetical protein
MKFTSHDQWHICDCFITKGVATRKSRVLLISSNFQTQIKNSDSNHTVEDSSSKGQK